MATRSVSGQTLYSRELKNVPGRVLAEADGSSDAGYAIALVHRDELLVKQVFGLRDREAALPVTSQTVFQLASISKGLTSMGMLLAEQQGQLSLARPLCEYSSLIRFADGKAGRAASLIDVLGHRTGIAAHDLLWYLVARSPRELARTLPRLPPIPDGFRSTFAYTNVVYAALAPLIEDVLGESFEQFLHRLVGGPLALHHLSVGGQPHAGLNGAAPYAGATRLAGKDLHCVSPGGGLCASLEDMVRWLCALLSKRSPFGQALDRALQTRADAKQMNPNWLQGWTQTGALEYGLGWFVSDLSGERMGFQPGFCSGFSTAFAIIPERELGVVVLSNQHLSPLPAQIAQALLAAALGLPAPAREAAAPAPTAGATRSTGDAGSAAWCGRFVNAAYGELRITHEMAETHAELGSGRFPVSQEGDTAVIHVALDGFHLPLPLSHQGHGAAETGVALPLGLDPRAPPVVFQRSEPAPGACSGE